MSNLELNQTGLSLPIKVVKVGEPPYDGDGWDDSKPYYLVDGADGTVLCGVTESLKKAFEYMAQCTNSDALAIDAEKLVQPVIDIVCSYNKSYVFGVGENERCRKRVAQLITDNIELDITWVDGKSMWGVFELYLSDPDDDWEGKITGNVIVHGALLFSEWFDTQELAKAACKKALKRIVTGGKG